MRAHSWLGTVCFAGSVLLFSVLFAAAAGCGSEATLDGDREVETDGDADAPDSSDTTDSPDGEPVDGDGPDADPEPEAGEGTEVDAAGDGDRDPEGSACPTPCTDHTACNPATGWCEPDATHCLVTGCAPQDECDPAGGECRPGPFAGYCEPCATNADCRAGSQCQRLAESRLSACSPACRTVSPACPSGARCEVVGINNSRCLPGDGDCGRLHALGGGCWSDDECDNGLFCIVETSPDWGVAWPRGFCTKSCGEPGSLTACGVPQTICSRFRFGDAEYTVCTPRCGLLTAGPCREGYWCSELEGGLSGCQPPDGKR